MNITDHNSFFGFKIEIRHVNEDWSHPKEPTGFFKPLLNRDHFEEVTESWFERVAWLVEKGHYPDIEEASDNESHHLPNEADYMPEFVHPTHFQAYSVSCGGVPISPVLEDPNSVLNYLSRKIIITCQERIWLLRNIKY